MELGFYDVFCVRFRGVSLWNWVSMPYSVSVLEG